VTPGPVGFLVFAEDTFLSGKTRTPKGDLPRRRGRLRAQTLAAQRLAVTLAGLGLFGVAAWADDPAAPPPAPEKPSSAPAEKPRKAR
jgi:hypothetical protein